MRKRSGPNTKQAAPSNRSVEPGSLRAHRIEQWLPAPAAEREPREAPPASTEGRPLGAGVRSFMDQRFGHDFARVRIHAGAEAARAAAAIDARAYTIGSDIVFGAAEYAPDTVAGRSLLAHELAHVIQQEGVPPGVARPALDNPAGGAEAAADAAARAALASAGSPALRLRDRLRGSGPHGPTIQRAVKTWGGTYDTDKYDLTSDPGMDGVEIELRFKPGKNVDAELIGMTQTARSLIKGAPVPTSSFGKAAAKTLESRTIPAGETGEGTRIDRISTHGNPLYATKLPKKTDALADTPTDPFWGQHGWRYTDKKGNVQKQDAILKDTPQLGSSVKESSQTFETTALAVKGAQAGTFYGSVQWGWEKDASGVVSKLPLKVISQGVPSAVFGAAAELWNKGKTSKGKETLDLPIVDVRVIDRDDVQLWSNPIDAMADLTPGTPVPRGTRIRILDSSDPLVERIEIVDGPMTGRTGYIVSLRSHREER